MRLDNLVSGSKEWNSSKKRTYPNNSIQSDKSSKQISSVAMPVGVSTRKGIVEEFSQHKLPLFNKPVSGKDILNPVLLKSRISKNMSAISASVVMALTNFRPRSFYDERQTKRGPNNGMFAQDLSVPHQM